MRNPKEVELVNSEEIRNVKTAVKMISSEIKISQNPSDNRSEIVKRTMETQKT